MADSKHKWLLKLSKKISRLSVRLPAKRKAAKEVLMALNDNFYTAPMTGNKFVANSKRIIEE